MTIIELLNEPLFNAIFGGIIIYFLIYLSNLGHPILGAILSSFPIGLLGLIAITHTHDRKEFIRSAVHVNIILVIVWLASHWFSKTIENNTTLIFIAYLIWLLLSGLYYFIRIRNKK